MAKNTKRRSGFLFILVIFILIGIIVFAYRDKFAVFFNTSFNAGRDFFSKKFSGNKKEREEKITKIDLFGKKDSSKTTENTKDNEQLKSEVEKLKESINEIKDKLDDKVQNNKNQTLVNKKEEKNNFQEITGNTDTKKQNMQVQSKNQNNIHNKTSYVYFSMISNDDKLKLVKVKREINYIDMPLTETLKSLLKGPNNDEKSKSIITNIPENTKLISVTIKNNIAYINLTKEFEYNRFGKDATINQLKQIVYTTTEFENIKAVQFLIEGKVKTYLGGEGITINKPINRNDLS
jgi:spore germination protein GerM